MNRNRMVWYATAASALLAAACFSDPTSSLRNGPALLELSRTTLSVRNGDSVAVTGTLVDAQGNPLPTNGAVWESRDPNIARVTIDTVKPAPGEIFTRAFVVGTTNTPGIVTVVATVGGLSDSVRVTVTPSTFPGTWSITGTPTLDTVITGRPAPLAPDTQIFTVGDTMVLTTPTNMTFNANANVSFGPFTGMPFFNDGSTLKVLARRGYFGKVTVNNMTFTGNTATGPIPVTGIQTDSIMIAKARFRGTAVAAANAVFGAGSNTIVVTAPNAAVKFDSLSGAVLGQAPNDTVRTLINTSARAATGTMTLIDRVSADTVRGNLKLTNVLVNGVRVDSLRLGPTPVTVGPVARATLFPGTVTILGAGNLLDTIVVRGNGYANFDVNSVVNVNGQAALLVLLTNDSLRVISKIAGGPATPTVTFRYGQTAVSSLAAQSGAITVNATTGEANEPANDNGAGAATITLNGKTPVLTFGAITANTNGDTTDYYKVVLASAGDLKLTLNFSGSSSSGSASNPNITLTLCSDVNCATVVDPGSGTQPKTITHTGSLGNPLAAGTYYIRVKAIAPVAANTYAYRLTASQ